MKLKQKNSMRWDERKKKKENKEKIILNSHCLWDNT